MGKSIGEIVGDLPAKRKAKVQADAQRMAEEMVAQAKSLDGLRKAFGKTQTELAKSLGIKQNAVSQLEKRADIYVSTLQRYVKSLGMNLEFSLTTSEGVRIDLPHFRPWEDVSLLPAMRPYGRHAGKASKVAALKRKAVGKNASAKTKGRPFAVEKDIR